MRHEEAVQGVFHIKAQNSGGGKDKKNNKWKNKKPAESSNKQQNDTFLPCPHRKKTNHSKKNVGGDLTSSAENVVSLGM